MFNINSGSLLRVAFTSILGSLAFDIGWYGIGNIWLLLGGIAALLLVVLAGWHAITRWQTTGYTRLSEKVPLPAAARARGEEGGMSANGRSAKAVIGQPAGATVAKPKTP